MLRIGIGMRCVNEIVYWSAGFDACLPGIFLLVLADAR